MPCQHFQFRDATQADIYRQIQRAEDEDVLDLVQNTRNFTETVETNET